MPDTIALSETVYVGKLLEVYSEEAGTELKTAKVSDDHAQWKSDLQKQRIRFYDAEAFMDHYRDQTEPGNH